jgi:hypothetical protein
MSDVVWVSNAYGDTTLTESFRPDISYVDKSLSAERVKRHKAGEAVGADEFPKQFQRRFVEDDQTKLPDFFSAGGWWCVSERFADVIHPFDLGGGGLYPVRMLASDGTTPLPGRFFGLDFGGRKNCVVPEQSRLRPADFPGVPPLVPFDHRDDDIVVTRAALEGADIWVDPGLFHSLFFSDRLMKALKSNGLAERPEMKRGRVLD